MILFGRKNSFAIEVLPLRDGPRDGDRSAELTWCSWALWAEGKNLTAHTRLDDERMSPTINWPAIYLARWLVHAWPDLFERPRWPIATRARNARLVLRGIDQQLVQAIDSVGEQELIDKRDRFCASHDLRSGASGGAYPGVFLSRDGDFVTVCWHSPPDDRVVFHRSSGEADVLASAFSQAVEGFVDWLLTLLPADEPKPVSLDRELLSSWLDSRGGDAAARSVIQGHSGIEDAMLERLMKRAGNTDFEAFFGLPQGWDEKGGDVSPSFSPVAVAFRSTSPGVSSDDLFTIRELVLRTEDNAAGRLALESARRVLPEPTGGTHDYEQGYELAISVRDWLENPEGRIDIEEVVTRTLEIRVEQIELSSEELEGGCVFDDRNGPVIFVNRNARMSVKPWGRRMTLAHELCHLLFDRRAALPLAHFSGIWSMPRIERRANAFAAELLLPRAGIARVLGEFPIDPTDDDYDRLMNEFNIGYTTVSWHIANRFGLT